MNDKLDELARGVAQSVTRRQALRRFCVGLLGVVLATFGVMNKAEATGYRKRQCLLCIPRCRGLECSDPLYICSDQLGNNICEFKKKVDCAFCSGCC